MNERRAQEPRPGACEGGAHAAGRYRTRECEQDCQGGTLVAGLGS